MVSDVQGSSVLLIACAARQVNTSCEDFPWQTVNPALPHIRQSVRSKFSSPYLLSSVFFKQS